MQISYSVVVEQDSENQLELPDVDGFEAIAEAGPSNFTRPDVKPGGKGKPAGALKSKTSRKTKTKNPAEPEIIDLDASEDETGSTSGPS